MTRIPERIRAVVDRVSYPGYSFRIGALGHGAFVQPTYQEPDVDNPAAGPVEQRGRKWYVSPHATESEIVQTCLAAVLMSAEHRVRENFLVDGVRLFGPHIAVEAHKDAATRREVRP